MKLLKHPTLIIFILSIAHIARAQNPNQSRTIEQMPVFQGEGNDFLRYITDNTIYPEVARTIGLQGEVMVSFSVNTDGKVGDVKALNNLGGGCDSEAVRVVSLSPPWKPALYNKHPVKITCDAPVEFSLPNKAIDKTFAHLKKSPYGFVFFIGGIVCTLDEAQAKLGKTYEPAVIQAVQKYNNPKFAMPDKQGVYLIIMRNAL